MTAVIPFHPFPPMATVTLRDLVVHENKEARTLVRASSVCLADRRRVLQAAFVPQRVLAACDLELAAFAQIALEDLAVISDVLDDLVGPVIGEADAGSEIALFAKQAYYFRICGARLLLIDVLLRHTEFFGVEESVV